MIAIANPVDGQPISYRAIAPGDSLASGEVSYSGDVPVNPVWQASDSTVVSRSDLASARITQSSIINSAYAAAIASGFTDPVTASIMSLTDQGRADLLGSAVAAVVSGAADGATITFATTTGTSTLPFGSVGAGIATDATFRGLVVRTLSAYLGLRSKLATLLGQIAAATDVAGVQAVTW